MNSLTQFKIFKEIPILPLLIPRIHNPITPESSCTRKRL